MTRFAGLEFSGSTNFARAGETVASIGDVNGDGFDDVIVTAPGYYVNDQEFFFQGAAYVVFGQEEGPASLSAAELDGTNGFLITPEGLPPFPGVFRNEVAFATGVGDVNGDGIDDFAVAGREQGIYGYYDASPDQTENPIYVIFGRAQGDGEPVFGEKLALGDLEATDGLRIDGVRGLLNGLQNAGDVNGDGVDDLLIGQTPIPAFTGFYGQLDPQDPVHAGYVVFGAGEDGGEATISVADLDGSNGFAIAGARTSLEADFFGELFVGDVTLGGVAALGDVDGDGFADIGVQVAAARNALVDFYDPDGGGGDPRDYDGARVERQTYVLFGRDDAPGAGTPFDAEVDPALAGEAIDWAGLSEDVIFRDAFAFLFGDFFEGGFFVTPELQGDPLMLGAPAGDFNGDGRDDVLLASPLVDFGADLPGNEDGREAFGGVFVQFGGPDRVTDGPRDASGLPRESDLDLAGDQAADVTILFSGGTDRRVVNAVAVGDIDGDGVDDIAVTVGSFFDAYFGEVSQVVARDEHDARSGSSVYLVFGDADLPQDAPTLIDLDAPMDEGPLRVFRIDGPDGSGSFGAATNGAVGALSPAGDVNGDGFDDLVIGDPFGGNQGPFGPFGGAWIVYGGPDALEAADRADGADDGVASVGNLDVDVDTGLLAIAVSLDGAGFVRVQNEGEPGAGAVFEFTAVRDGDLSQTVAFDFTVAGSGPTPADGADFVGGVLPSGRVEFGVGEAAATFQVSIAGDDDIEGNEDFTVSLSNLSATGPSPAALAGGSVRGRIVNDDFPMVFTAARALAEEGDVPGDAATLVFEVIRFGDVNGAASVDFSLALGSAQADDLEPGEAGRTGTLTFADGETSRTVTVQIAEDEVIENDETVLLTLSNAVSDAGAPTRIDGDVATGIIVNDDRPPTIEAIGPGFIVEGDSGAQDASFVITRDGDLGAAAEVGWTLSPSPNIGDLLALDSGDVDGVLPRSGLARFEIGEDRVVVPLSVLGDLEIEPRESARLQITSVTSEGGIDYQIDQSRAFVTVLNNDGRPPVIPPGVEADVFGDPHIVTLDGLGYDFQAVGEYILVETLPGAANPFQVQVRFEPLPGSDLVSVTTRLAVEIAGAVVELDALGASTLLIDGAAPSAEDLARGAVDLDGDGVPEVFFDAALTEFFLVLNDENEQLMVKNMDGALNACVFLADSPDGNQGNVRGLMGDADGDGDTSDDLALRDGTVLPQPVPFDDLYGRFADSWRVDGTGDKAPLFSNTTTFPDGFPAGVLKIDELPAAVREAAEAAAIAAGLDPLDRPAVFEAAVLDFALTGNPAFFEGALGLAAEQTAATRPSDAPALPQTVGVTAADMRIDEGDAGSTAVGFTLYRIGDASGAIDIDWTLEGTAAADDLAPGAAMSGTVSLADGETAQEVVVEVVGDLRAEGDETLVLRIAAVSDPAALIGAPTATTTIVDDEAAPVAEDDELAVQEGAELTGDLTAANGGAADSDADDDPLSVTAIIDEDGVEHAADGEEIILPSGARLVVSASGAFSYAAAGPLVPGRTRFEALAQGALGMETFRYRLSDATGGEDEADVLINVIGVNTAPIVGPDEVQAAEGGSVSGNVLDNDEGPEPADMLFIASVQGEETNVRAAVRGTYGELVLDVDGSFTYFADRPDALDAGEVGRDVFVFDVSDGSLVTSGTLVVDVAGASDAPKVTNGPDRLNGDNGDDRINGRGGDDVINGRGGDDVLLGAAGNDRIKGGTGNDRINGGGGNDVLAGQGGNDRLIGGGGRDRIDGGGGRDVINGGKGNDRLKGGKGPDDFQFRRGDGKDVLEDFRPNLDDIEITRGAKNFAQLEIYQRGKHAFVEYGGRNDLIKILRTDADDLDAKDFIF